MSREGAPTEREKATEQAVATPAAGTPIWVWLVYALGLLAAVIFAFSLLFTLGAVVLSEEDVPVSYDVSLPAIVLWGAFMLGALALWMSRRRRR